jgi:hypothetical protein
MIVSQKRILANRRNALKSTGPRTAEGKRRSSRNSLKHGHYAALSFEFLKLSPLPEDKVIYERLKKSVEKARQLAVPKRKKGRPKVSKKIRIQPIRHKAVKPVPRKPVKPARRKAVKPVQRKPVKPVRRKPAKPVHRKPVKPVKTQKKKKATGKKR